ncbi:MAG: AIM24 family protein [Candidatus Eremiobacteraeota bacterium]|nr:AIM24 family protein [Candidatus Eremiobacteraeota bacterium]
MKPKITGTTMPVLEIELERGDTIVAEPGEFSWMSDSVQLKTTPMTAGAKGLLGILGRAVSGGGIFMTEYTAPSATGLVAFAAKLPGAIVQVDVQPGHGYLIHRHGFLCATQGLELSIGFQKSLGAGIFGGDGFVMQRLAGTCSAWVELGGEIVTYDLQPGQVLSVHPGHVGMFQESVNFDITFMRGVANAIFGGDGLFIARLTGPGKVWLQTLTVPGLAHAMQPYLHKEAAAQTAQAGVVGGIAGSVMRDIFGGS